MYELINLWPSYVIKLEFRNVDFCGGRKTGEPGEKTLEAKERINNKLNSHMM
jgi:hypothetical protein